MLILSLKCLVVLIFMFKGEASYLRGPTYFRSPQQWSKQKQVSILFYVTTHASEEHLWFWKHKWSLAAHRDIYVYFTNKKLDTDWFTAVPLLGYSVNSNPGYQEGAIQAMHDEAVLRDIDVNRFDWVIRLNPDVEILNMGWLRDMLRNSKHKVITAKCMANGLPMTDFTIMKPDIFAKILKLKPTFNNAEIDLWNCLRRLKVDIQYLPIPWPKNHNCRVLFPGVVMHKHRK